MPSFTVFKGHPSGTPIKSTTTKPDKLTGDSVLVRVTASGVCGTDLHYRHADLVLGHEGVGIVEAVGPATTILKPGDRVGWGYETGSCGHCRECLQGTENFCAKRALYGQANYDQGSFASHAIWRESFLYRIPDTLSDIEAAPLQCGGATVYAALQDIKPSETVGILGIGGLGHLAIQFAARMGCHVVVLSGTSRKREDALKLGAHEFINMNGDGAGDSGADSTGVLKVSRPVDRLLVTTASPPNWDRLLPLLAPRSRVYPLTVNMGTFEIPYMALILNGISVVGSLVASRHVHQAMLEFAARNKVRSIVETYPMTEEGIQEALEKLDRGEMYYRGVLIPQ
ncbi:chaperonin 10-like protein [Aspergillus keveii]|uniref:Chaperonin 10-like protein n=1 Tax=Aspergillus keveii TaxID=714993 RepID=A0ABR4FKZ5_9EURO